MNGRIDLVQAEAVLGVIDAADHEELEQALEQLAGGVSQPLAAIRTDLIALLGDLEAGLDFVEEDIEFVGQQQLIDRLNSAAERLSFLMNQTTTRMVATDRPRVVLAGPPNAGKSTLFNALIETNSKLVAPALVSPASGTTRDYLAQSISIGGLEIELIDTAGIETTSSENDIAGQAQQLGRDQHSRADLVLWCSPLDEAPSFGEEEKNATENDWTTAFPEIPRERLIRLGTKSDLAQPLSPEAFDMCLSVANNHNLMPLLELVAQRLSAGASGRGMLGSTSARCQQSLRDAILAMHSAIGAVTDGMGDEIVALEIRAGLDHIGQILGVVYTDDILDHIFSSFCIGK